MPRLGIAGGNATRDVELPSGAWAYVERHAGGGEYTLPHEIDHVANMRTLADEGCERVLALGSVGGLHRELGPGTFVCPDDFLSIAGPSSSIHRGREAHAVPGFDPGWRGEVLAAWERAADLELRDGGVYAQTPGPRLETPAEVRLLAEYADVVGMTIADECVAASELGLAYAAVCVVDNLANGVGGEALDPDELEAGMRAHHTRLVAALTTVLPELA